MIRQIPMPQSDWGPIEGDRRQRSTRFPRNFNVVNNFSLKTRIEIYKMIRCVASQVALHLDSIARNAMAGETNVAKAFSREVTDCNSYLRSHRSLHDRRKIIPA
jgi:hypothetical protein